MADETIRIGLLGAGSIAIYRHAPEVTDNPYAEIAAIYDPITERAEGLAEAVGCDTVSSEEGIIEHDALDAVIVATPNAHHARLSIAVMEAGKDVLCEKPMATSVEDAAAMIETSKKTGRKLMIGHNQRLMPPHIKARELIEEGAIGKVLSFRTSFGHGGPEMWSQDQGPHTWFFKKEEAFVGSMGDLGVHKADLVRWLVGSEVTEASAFVETLAKENEKGEKITVDDNAVCILKMANGAVGQLTASWTYGYGEDNTTIIYGSEGMLALGLDPDFPVQVNLNNGEMAQYRVGAMATNEVQVASGIPDMFIDALLDDVQPEIDGNEGYRALAIVVACLESAETGQVTKVKA